MKRFRILRIARRAALLPLIFLLSLTVALPLFAASETEESYYYADYYDDHCVYTLSESNAKATVYLYEDYAKTGEYDLLPLFRNTALANVCLYIEVGDVTVCVNPETVKKTADRGEPLKITVRKIESETEKAEKAADGDEKETEKNRDITYEILISNFTFSYKSVKLGYDYKPQNSDAVRVFAVESEKEFPLRSGCTKSVTYFYPKTLGTFTLTERPESRDSTVLILLLTAVLFAVLLLFLAFLCAVKRRGGRIARLGERIFSAFLRKAHTGKGVTEHGTNAWQLRGRRGS